MKRQIKRLSVLQTGKILGMLYVFVSLIIFPLLAFSVWKGRVWAGVLILGLLYPILGFIGGMLLAVFYNLSAKILGGLEFEVEDVEECR